SGKAGSVDEKLEAALELDIETIMIKRPKIQYGNVFSDFESVLTHIKELFKTKTV
ncbi:MAG TPA: precorrin-6A/cobalt-precorrin-6A reductase, partial [Metabacillus sp.]|nr:precorrin-6A/cobalt-precorrin-6A reductase [Metabacillus sp.]